MAVRAIILFSSFIFRDIVLWTTVTDCLPSVMGHPETVSSRMHNFMGPTTSTQQLVYTGGTDGRDINNKNPQIRLLQAHRQGWKPNIGDLFQKSTSPSESGKQFFKTWTSSDATQDKSVGSSLSKNEFLRSKMNKNAPRNGIEGFQSWSSKPTFINNGQFTLTDNSIKNDHNSISDAMFQKLFPGFPSVNNISNGRKDVFRTWSSGNFPPMKNSSIPSPVFYNINEVKNGTKLNQQTFQLMPPINLNRSANNSPLHNLPNKVNRGIERLQPFPNVGHTVDPRSFTKPSETFQTMFEKLMMPSAIPFSSDNFINMPESIKMRIEARRALQARNADRAEREKGTKIDRIFKRLPLSDFKRNHLKVSSQEIQKRLKEVVTDWVRNKTAPHNQTENKEQQTVMKSEPSKVNGSNKTEKNVNIQRDKDRLNNLSKIKQNSPLSTNIPVTSTFSKLVETSRKNQTVAELFFGSRRTTPKSMSKRETTISVIKTATEPVRLTLDALLSENVNENNEISPDVGHKVGNSSSDDRYSLIHDALIKEGVFQNSVVEKSPMLNSGDVLIRNKSSRINKNNKKDHKTALSNQPSSMKHDENRVTEKLSTTVLLLDKSRRTPNVLNPISDFSNNKSILAEDKTRNGEIKISAISNSYPVIETKVNSGLKMVQESFTRLTTIPVLAVTAGLGKKNTFSKEKTFGISKYTNVQTKQGTQNMYATKSFQTTEQSKFITVKPTSVQKNTDSLQIITGSNLSSHVLRKATNITKLDTTFTTPTHTTEKDNISTTTSSENSQISIDLTTYSNTKNAPSITTSLAKALTIPKADVTKTSEEIHAFKYSTYSPAQLKTSSVRKERGHNYSMQADDYSVINNTPPSVNYIDSSNITKESISKSANLSNMIFKESNSSVKPYFESNITQAIAKTNTKEKFESTTEAMTNYSTKTIPGNESKNGIIVKDKKANGTVVQTNRRNEQINLKTEELKFSANSLAENTNIIDSFVSVTPESPYYETGITKSLDPQQTVIEENNKNSIINESKHSFRQKLTNLSKYSNNSSRVSPEDTESTRVWGITYSSISPTESAHTIKSTSSKVNIVSHGKLLQSKTTLPPQNSKSLIKNETTHQTSGQSHLTIGATSSVPAITKVNFTQENITKNQVPSTGGYQRTDNQALGIKTSTDKQSIEPHKLQTLEANSEGMIYMNVTNTATKSLENQTSHSTSEQSHLTFGVTSSVPENTKVHYIPESVSYNQVTSTKGYQRLENQVLGVETSTARQFIEPRKLQTPEANSEGKIHINVTNTTTKSLENQTSHSTSGQSHLTFGVTSSVLENTKVQYTQESVSYNQDTSTTGYQRLENQALGVETSTAKQFIEPRKLQTLEANSEGMIYMNVTKTATKSLENQTSHSTSGQSHLTFGVTSSVPENTKVQYTPESVFNKQVLSTEGYQRMENQISGVEKSTAKQSIEPRKLQTPEANSESMIYMNVTKSTTKKMQKQTNMPYKVGESLYNYSLQFPDASSKSEFLSTGEQRTSPLSVKRLGTRLPVKVSQGQTKTMSAIIEDPTKVKPVTVTDWKTSIQKLKNTFKPKENKYNSTPSLQSKNATIRRPGKIEYNTSATSKLTVGTNTIRPSVFGDKNLRSLQVSDGKSSAKPKMKTKARIKQFVTEATSSAKPGVMKVVPGTRQIVTAVRTKTEVLKNKSITRPEVSERKTTLYPSYTNPAIKGKHSGGFEETFVSKHLQNQINTSLNKKLVTKAKNENSKTTPHTVALLPINRYSDTNKNVKYNAPNKIEERNPNKIMNNLQNEINQYNFENTIPKKIRTSPLVQTPIEHKMKRFEPSPANSNSISYNARRNQPSYHTETILKHKVGTNSRSDGLSKIGRPLGRRNRKPRQNKFEALLLELTRNRNIYATSKQNLKARKKPYEMSDQVLSPPVYEQKQTPNLNLSKPKYSLERPSTRDQYVISLVRNGINNINNQKAIGIKNHIPEKTSIKSTLVNQILQSKYPRSSVGSSINNQEVDSIHKYSNPGASSTKLLENLLAENTRNSVQLFSLPKSSRNHEAKPKNKEYLQPRRKTVPISILDMLHNDISKIKKDLKPVLPKLADQLNRDNFLKSPPLNLISTKTFNQPSLKTHRVKPINQVGTNLLENVSHQRKFNQNMLELMQRVEEHNRKRIQDADLSVTVKKETKSPAYKNSQVKSETMSGINILNTLLSGQTKRDRKVQLFNISPLSSNTKVSKMLFNPSDISKKKPISIFKPLNVQSSLKSNLDVVNTNNLHQDRKVKRLQSSLENKRKPIQEPIPSPKRKENPKSNDPNIHEKSNMVIRHWLNKFKSKSNQEPVSVKNARKRLFVSKAPNKKDLSKDVRYRGIRPKRINLFNSDNILSMFTSKPQDYRQFIRDIPKENALEHSAFKISKNEQFINEKRPNDDLPTKPLYQHKQVKTSKPKVISLWNLTSPFNGKTLLEQLSASDNTDKNSVPIMMPTVTHRVDKRKVFNSKKDTNLKLAPYNGSIETLLFPKHFAF